MDIIQLYLINTGIAGHEFATTVCQGKAQAYLNKAASFHFPVNLTIKQAVEELAGKLGVEGNIFYHWSFMIIIMYLLILTKQIILL